MAQVSEWGEEKRKNNNCESETMKLKKKKVNAFAFVEFWVPGCGAIKCDISESNIFDTSRYRLL